MLFSVLKKTIGVCLFGLGLGILLVLLLPISIIANILLILLAPFLLLSYPLIYIIYTNSYIFFPHIQ